MSAGRPSGPGRGRLPFTYALRRFDDARLKEALAALAKARAEGEASPLYPWMESWRIDGVLSDRPLTPDDFRALLERCAIGREIDLLDRTPAAFVEAAEVTELSEPLAAFERGAGLEPWMRIDVYAAEPPRDGVLGVLGPEEVARLQKHLASLSLETVLPEEDERATYAHAWERLRRGFAAAAERGEGLALVYQA